MEENLDTALEIINTLLQSKEISRTDNQQLYQSYVNSAEVENLTNRIAEKMGFNIYRFNNTLNLCVMLNNKIFGYTNEELKRKVKMLNKNEDIYLMYFIILTIITCFYKESRIKFTKKLLKFR